ncbi:MAG TPA: ATP-binding protein [Acetobacteraceae bacterium]|nr:ATP-binding protein [Acetobacteraceae bacterium]
MLAWLSGIWLTQGYLPHGLCLAWQPWLIWLELTSDALIALSYYSIPAALAYFAIRRRDLPFRGVFVLFILFILACGTTHALGAATLWDPIYRLDGFVKLLTALVSVPTAVTLWLLLPAALAMPSHEQLAALNRSLSHEIEERRRAEQAMRDLNVELDQRVQTRTALLQSILDTVPDALVVVDARGAIESFSAAAEQLFGFTANEVQGRGIALLIPELQSADLDDPLEQYRVRNEGRAQPAARTATGKRKDETTFPMELSVGAVRHGEQRLFTCFVQDLTERQEAEHRVQELQAELAHVSRLTEMGQLASGIAHELNQPLSATTNYLGAAKRLLERGDAAALNAVKEAIDRASAQVLRAGEIIQRLRGFVKRSEPERRPEEVVGLLEEASSLALVGARERSVPVDFRTAPALPPVLVDRVQIQQVIVNLLRNAVEAMEASPRREITIDVAPASDGLVAIGVADTGHGIAQNIAQRLFQPFNTTKAHGMGVGLSLCRSIVEAHGGRLWAEPNPAGGTIFRFTVPVSI